MFGTDPNNVVMSHHEFNIFFCEKNPFSKTNKSNIFMNGSQLKITKFYVVKSLFNIPYANRM